MEIMGILVFGLFYLAIFAMLGIFFYYMADMLCEPLVSADLGWLYFAIMSLIAIALGVFGSVFNTFSSLYQAKDNDLLLSLPIPASKILAIRLMGVYTMGVMYEFIVMIPTLIAWQIQCSWNRFQLTDPTGIIGIDTDALLYSWMGGSSHQQSGKE